MPLKLQQQCLDIFNDALSPGVDDTTNLQDVKGHLYNRDFIAAFGRDEYLRVYASRWSPSRALGYLQVLADVQGYVLHGNEPSRPGQSNQDAIEVVCLGGGAGAEAVALAGWLSAAMELMPGAVLQVCFVDIAAWSATVDALHKRCVTAPELSKYASITAREANKPCVRAEAYSCSFQQQDVLDWPEDALRLVVTPETRLVTLLFTLNELYSTSVPKTQRLLSKLTATMAAGALILVVDSPGSYSTLTLNGAEKKYPMQWLLDHTLLGSPQKAGVEQAAKWEKVVSDESRWFRLPKGLQYPIELENMRYQIHLYRRLADSEGG